MIGKEYTVAEIEGLWLEFEDIPMGVETEKIEQPFLHFPTGAHKYAIWDWFDRRYPSGVNWLVNRINV